VGEWVSESVSEWEGGRENKLTAEIALNFVSLVTKLIIIALLSQTWRNLSVA
jgi:hypothetical protein